VIGFLRFVGVMNAAVWLGAAVFFTFGAGPALFSDDMRKLLGEANHPYFSGAIAQIVLVRYFHLHLVCGIVAALHLLAEALYLGRPAQKLSLGLLGFLLFITLASGFWLQPKVSGLHVTRYAVNAPAAQREASARSFRVWHGVSQFLNVLMMGGLVVYVWRVANPSDTLRFVSPAKFRG
jgi:hypothetical protein